MNANRSLCVMLLVTSLCQSSPAAEYVQKQGRITLHLGLEPLGDGTLRMRLSDQLSLTLTIDGDPPVEPIALLERGSPWDVKPEPSSTETLPDGQKRWQQRFTLSPRKPGDVPLDMHSQKIAGEVISFDPIVIRVTTVITRADPKELRDVLPPEAVPPVPGLPAWVPWLGGGLFVVALAVPLAILARRWLRRRAPELLPHEEALRGLARIEAMKLPESGEVNRYHTLLADVVRRYAERRFNLSAARQTSSEFLTAVRSSPELSPEQQELLGQFLTRCDLAKFAKVTHSPEECQVAAQMARTFIEQTIPIEKEAGKPHKGAHAT